MGLRDGTAVELVGPVDKRAPLVRTGAAVSVWASAAGRCTDLGSSSLRSKRCMFRDRCLGQERPEARRQRWAEGMRLAETEYSSTALVGCC
jgi:hypothetical protein